MCVQADSGGMSRSPRHWASSVSSIGAASNVRYSPPSTVTAPAINFESVTIDDLTVEKVRVGSTSNTGALRLSSAVINTVRVKDLTAVSTSTIAGVIYLLAATVVGSLEVNGFDVRISGSSFAYTVRVGASANIGVLRMRGGRMKTSNNTGALVEVDSGGPTLGALMVEDVYLDTVYRLAQLGVATAVLAANVKGVGTAGTVLSTGGLVTLNGSNIDATGSAHASTTAPGTLRSVNGGLPMDASLVASHSAGDLVNNTNAALPCGVGLCQFDGTNWVSLATGASYVGQ
jgi:hypothetical protein